MTVKVHIHPKSGQELLGEQLIPGETIRDGDLYDATSGRWDRCPFVGNTVEEGSAAIIIRPASSDMWDDWRPGPETRSPR